MDIIHPSYLVSTKEDIEANQLGSPPNEKLLHLLKPTYWFAAHLHCQFAAIVKHDEGNEETKFLALDKCLPKRRHLQVLKLPEEYDGDKQLKYDAEWLAVLKNTNHLLSVKNVDCHLPGPGGNETYEFTPTAHEIDSVRRLMGDLIIRPNTFVRTAPIYNPAQRYREQMEPYMNPQTVTLCEKLGIDDPLQVLLARSGRVMKESCEKPSTSEPEPTINLNPEPIANITPRSYTKLSLPAPVTPMENDESEDLSQRSTFFSPNSSCISSHNNSSSDTTPNSITPRKTFKRRNLEMYTPDEDMSETSSSFMDDDSPRSSKYICRNSGPFS